MVFGKLKQLVYNREQEGKIWVGGRASCELLPFACVALSNWILDEIMYPVRQTRHAAQTNDAPYQAKRSPECSDIPQTSLLHCLPGTHHGTNSLIALVATY